MLRILIASLFAIVVNWGLLRGVACFVPICIALRTDHGLYVTAKGSDEGWNIDAATAVLDKFEKFKLIYVGNGQVAFKTYHGQYVSAKDAISGDREVKANVAKISHWEKFALIAQEDGRVAI